MEKKILHTGHSPSQQQGGGGNAEKYPKTENNPVQGEVKKLTFTDIKWAVGEIQMNNLSIGSSGTTIEANPATHRIAEYIFDLLVRKDGVQGEGKAYSLESIMQAIEYGSQRKAMDEGNAPYVTLDDFLASLPTPAKD